MNLWMHCLAYVETEPVSVPNCVGWIKNDYDDVWLKAITTVPAELIVRVAVLITTTKEPKDLYGVPPARYFSRF